MIRFLTFFALVGMVLLAACAPTANEPVSEPTAVSALPTAVDTAQPAPPTPTPIPTTTTEPEPPAQPTPLPEATADPEPEPDPSPTAVDTPTVTAPQVVYGRTAEGAFFRGNPNADVVLIDYSDFL